MLLPLADETAVDEDAPNKLPPKPAAPKIPLLVALVSMFSFEERGAGADDVFADDLMSAISEVAGFVDDIADGVGVDSFDSSGVPCIQ